MAGDRDTVILLHGFFGVPWMMNRLERDLKGAGYATLAPFYDSWRQPLDRIVARLSGRMTAAARETPGRLHFVGHSMGGIVARALIRQHRPERLGHVVMLGTPNGGSEIADLLHGHAAARMILGQAAPVLVTRREQALLDRLGPVDYSAGVVAGTRSDWEGPFTYILPRPNDGKVSLASTHVEGEADHIALPVPHRRLPYDRSVRAQALHFLREGRFDHGALPDRAQSVITAV
jgi:pimeloyl-ACP methyl ester carboxylesterase